MRRASLADYEEVKAICEREGGGDPYRLLADPRNVILIEHDNCAMFLWRWIGIYEGHALFAKRGKLAIDLGALFLDLMFKSGAVMILAVISKDRPQASWFVRKLGFSLKGETVTVEGLSELYQLEAETWAL